MRPKISVIIPTYNNARFLPSAIESVLAQTVRPLELIIADDGSEDNTEAVARSYGANVEYLRFEHGGVYAVRQSVLSKIRGEWFLNLDADNWIEPEFIDKVSEVIESNRNTGNLAFVYTDMRQFGDREAYVKRPDFDVGLLKRGNYLDMNSVIRTEQAREIGFDRDFNDGQGDYDLFLSLVKRGYVGVRVPEALVHYRIHNDSISRIGQKKFRHSELAARILRKHSDFFSPQEAAFLRSGARKGRANTMWSEAALKYEEGQYKVAAQMCAHATVLAPSLVTTMRISLFVLSSVVALSGGVLCMSRPLQYNESRAAMARAMGRALRKLAYLFAGAKVFIKGREGPRVWVDIKNDDGERSVPKIRTLRAVNLQDFMGWGWLGAEIEPSMDDYIVTLNAGDEPYPEMLHKLYIAAKKQEWPDIVYFDHAWWNGESSLQPCFKPQFTGEEITRNVDILLGSALIKARHLQRGRKNGDDDDNYSFIEGGKGTEHEALTCCHVRAVLMNKIVPCELRHEDVFPDDQSQAVSIIIPTKNHAALLSRCIETIREHTAYRNYEIVIVDNGSTDKDTLDYLDGCGERVVYDPSRFNFSKLVNAGAHASSSPLILFLNDDIEVPESSPRWLHALVSTTMEDGVGVAGAQLNYPCGATQHAGVGLFPALNGGIKTRNLFSGQVNRDFWADRRRECLAVTGACQMIRREVFDDVGGYDEDFPVVCNDVDFCLRVRDKGWRIVYQPAASLIHREGVSKGGTKVFAKSIQDSHIKFDERWRHKYGFDPFSRAEWEKGV